MPLQVGGFGKPKKARVRKYVVGLYCGAAYHEVPFAQQKECEVVRLYDVESDMCKLAELFFRRGGFFVFGCCVSWRSKIQTITAGSTHEAEIIAIALAANEGVWIRKLLPPALYRARAHQGSEAPARARRGRFSINTGVTHVTT